jgi:pyridoxal phosphate enzyme (YggS family)
LAINKTKIKEIKSFLQNHHNTSILAVTKNRDIIEIKELIKNDFLLFGENRVQEAIKKFIFIKKEHKNISLHLIGPLQSNKALDALKVFDCIQSIDREKIAKIIAQNINHDWCVTKNFFIQINIGKEIQKTGIEPDNARDFYHYCIEMGLNIKGLMCIPPIGKNVEEYFKKMENIKDTISNQLTLSMGMSGDYQQAVYNGSNLIRIGSALFE